MQQAQRASLALGVRPRSWLLRAYATSVLVSDAPSMGELAAVPLWLWYSRWGLAEAMDGRDERATQEQKSPIGHAF